MNNIGSAYLNTGYINNYKHCIPYYTPSFKQNYKITETSVETAAKNKKTILKGISAILGSLGILKITKYLNEKIQNTKTNQIKKNTYETHEAKNNVSDITSEETPVITTSDISKTRGVDFNKLDKNKTYIGMQYGRRNRLARNIVKYTTKYCPNSDVPAHVFALSYKDGDWWVYEAHIIKNEQLGIIPGSHKLKAADWNTLGKNAIAETDIYEVNLNIEALDKNIGQPYGKGDMIKQLLASIFNKNGKQSDSRGLLCSEYLAISLDEICDFYHLPPWCITPAHFKDYMIHHGAKQVN